MLLSVYMDSEQDGQMDKFMEEKTKTSITSGLRSLLATSCWQQRKYLREAATCLPSSLLFLSGHLLLATIRGWKLAFGRSVLLARAKRTRKGLVEP